MTDSVINVNGIPLDIICNVQEPGNYFWFLEKNNDPENLRKACEYLLRTYFLAQVNEQLAKASFEEQWFHDMSSGIDEDIPF